MRGILVISLCFINTFSTGYVVKWYSSTGPDWNDLRVKWDENVFSSYAFAEMPRNKDDAFDNGFNKVSDCGAIPGIYGNAYVKDNDYSLILLYDVNGYIAGIRIGVSKNSGANYPPQRQINHPFVDGGDRYYLTAYFIKPDRVCTTGRTAVQFAINGTGDALYIQNGTDAAVNSLLIPRNEADIGSTKWSKGKCFYSMGMHYWYNVKEDMSCDDFFPVFLLYNKGKLNAFGWALGTPMTSERMEHPPQSVIKDFINPVPQCLLKTSQLSTMHIYLTSAPYKDLC